MVHHFNKISYTLILTLFLFIKSEFGCRDEIPALKEVGKLLLSVNDR